MGPSAEAGLAWLRLLGSTSGLPQASVSQAGCGGPRAWPEIRPASPGGGLWHPTKGTLPTPAQHTLRRGLLLLCS